MFNKIAFFFNHLKYGKYEYLFPLINQFKDYFLSNYRNTEIAERIDIRKDGRPQKTITIYINFKIKTKELDRMRKEFEEIKEFLRSNKNIIPEEDDIALWINTHIGKEYFHITVVRSYIKNPKIMIMMNSIYNDEED